MSHASARTARLHLRAEDLAFPVAGGRNGSKTSMASALATLMALCGGFAMFVSHLPHPGF